MHCKGGAGADMHCKRGAGADMVFGARILAVTTTHVTTQSAPVASASAMRNSSLRTLFPVSSRPVMSSRFMNRCGGAAAPPAVAAAAGKADGSRNSCTGVGCDVGTSCTRLAGARRPAAQGGGTYALTALMKGFTFSKSSPRWWKTQLEGGGGGSEG
jgi:hypothetical protein